MVVDVIYKHIKRKNREPLIIYSQGDKEIIFFYSVKDDWASIIGFNYSAFVIQKDLEYGQAVYNDSLKDLIWECFHVLNKFGYDLDRELFKLYFENGDVYVEK